MQLNWTSWGTWTLKCFFFVEYDRYWLSNPNKNKPLPGGFWVTSKKVAISDKLLQAKVTRLPSKTLYRTLYYNK